MIRKSTIEKYYKINKMLLKDTPTREIAIKLNCSLETIGKARKYCVEHPRTDNVSKSIKGVSKSIKGVSAPKPPILPIIRTKDVINNIYIDSDEFLKWVGVLDPNDYPTCKALITRYQTHKRKGFLLDAVYLVNKFYRVQNDRAVKAWNKMNGGK